MASQKTKVTFEITDRTGAPAAGVQFELLDLSGTALPNPKPTKAAHVLQSELDAGEYIVRMKDKARSVTREVRIRPSAAAEQIRLVVPAPKVVISPTPPVRENGPVRLTVVPDPPGDYDVSWKVDPAGGALYRGDKPDAIFDPPAVGKSATYTATATLTAAGGTEVVTIQTQVKVEPRAGVAGSAALFEAAKDVAYMMKDNIDQRFDALTDRISPAGTSLADQLSPAGGITVRLQRAAVAGPTATSEEALWIAIRNRTDAIGFNRFSSFVNRVLCVEPTTDTTGVANTALLARQVNELALNPQRSVHGSGAYEILRTAAQVFLLAECGVAFNVARNAVTGQPGPAPVGPLPEESDRLGRPITFDQARQLIVAYLGATNRLPYLQTVVNELFAANDQGEVSPFCLGILRTRFSCPLLLELIWSYWLEEGMVVQTINAISRRFQNIRGPAMSDPLAQLELDPLRPVSNLVWGFIADEPHRLTVVRRAYEYNHHYGLRLFGKAVPELRPADSRSKFLEAFHNLLYLAAQFYKQADDTTVVPDGFPVLNAIKEVHLLLSEGAHGQYGDLPWTARAETLAQQWILARQEFREYLPSRVMVAYPEPWMQRVDSMKRLQGWTDVSVLHFSNLANFGERLLLAIRFGNWSAINSAQTAAAFAQFWREEVQGYIHSYRAVTGVDLTLEPVNYTAPSVLLRQRLASDKAAAR
jgi:hypothetical protein